VKEGDQVITPAGVATIVKILPAQNWWRGGYHRPIRQQAIKVKFPNGTHHIWMADKVKPL
jgi:hypothetical protein